MAVDSRDHIIAHDKQAVPPAFDKAILEARQKILLLKARCDSKQDVERYEHAVSATAACIGSYWDCLQKGRAKSWPLPNRTLDRPALELDEYSLLLLDDIGTLASKLDPVSAGFVIGELFTALLPDEHRTRYGVYFTPPALTARLLEMASHAGIEWSSCRVLDPACGGGAFLTPVALKIVSALGERNPSDILEHLSSHLRGCELDPFSAWMSHVLLEAALLGICQRAGRRLPNVIEVGDAFSRPLLDAAFDLVVANPPFGRVTLSAELRSKYSRSLHGHANMYGMFMDLAVQLAEPDGMIAYITPTGFLGGEYFKALRALMAKQAPPVAIELVIARKGVFSGVLQETLLAIYRCGGDQIPADVSVLSVSTTTKATAMRVGSFSLPRTATDPWILPRRKEHEQLIARAQELSYRLRDYGYKVSTGPLVWNRHKSQLHDKPITGAFPIVWAESIASDGRFIYRTEKRNHKPYFLPTSADDWLLTRSACILVQRTTAKEQYRRLIAAELPVTFVRKHGAVSIENHVNMVKPLDDKPLVPIEIVTAMLNSVVVDTIFRCISGSVAVSASELEALPLPSPQAASQLGSLLATSAAPSTIERAIRDLYTADGD